MIKVDISYKAYDESEEFIGIEGASFCDCLNKVCAVMRLNQFGRMNLEITKVYDGSCEE